jgi:hypothetical protein
MEKVRGWRWAAFLQLPFSFGKHSVIDSFRGWGSIPLLLFCPYKIPLCSGMSSQCTSNDLFDIQLTLTQDWSQLSFDIHKLLCGVWYPCGIEHLLHIMRNNRLSKKLSVMGIGLELELEQVRKEEKEPVMTIQYINQFINYIRKMCSSISEWGTKVE